MRYRQLGSSNLEVSEISSGIELSPDTLAAIDEALDDIPVKEPTLAQSARAGVTHR